MATLPRSVTLHGWTVTAAKQPISNAPESETYAPPPRTRSPPVSASAALHLRLPEIFFGNNRLSLTRTVDQLSLQFDPLEALQAVSSTADVKVAHAAEWAKGCVSHVLLFPQN